MMEEKEKEITWVQRWAFLNQQHQTKLITGDPLLAEHHRGEAEMFGKVINLLNELKATA